MKSISIIKLIVKCNDLPIIRQKQNLGRFYIELSQMLQTTLFPGS